MEVTIGRSEIEVQAQRIVDLIHVRCRYTTDPSIETLDRDRPNLFRLSLGVPRQSTDVSRQFDLKR